MIETNLIAVERAEGYSKEQAYLLKVNSGYSKGKKADDAMLEMVKKQYRNNIVVDSQIKEIRETLVGMAGEVNAKFPKCKKVEVSEICDFSDDYGIKRIWFGGSEARLDFEAVNPLMHASWQACV